MRVLLVFGNILYFIYFICRHTKEIFFYSYRLSFHFIFYRLTHNQLGQNALMHEDLHSRMLNAIS